MSSNTHPTIGEEKTYAFHLIRGKEQCGTPYYAFILMNSKRSEEIIQTKTVDLAKDGLLILKGQGKNVPDSDRFEAMRRFKALMVTDKVTQH